MTIDMAARHRPPTTARPSSLASAAPLAGADGDAHHPADIRLMLPARPASIVVVRDALTAIARALGLPTAIVDDLRLAVTEACTNVVRHAYQDGDGPIEVTVQPAGAGGDGPGDTLRVIVADRGRGIMPSADRDGPGLGLELIAALSDELEISHRPGAGAELSMTFSRPSRSARTKEDGVR